MAADSLISDQIDSVAGFRRKITRGRTGALFGAAGDAYAIALALKHVRYARTLDALLAMPKTNVLEGILVTPDGQIHFVDHKGRVLDVKAPFTAVGHGASFAIGAMAAGATAVEAVRIASKHDRSTGGRIHKVSL